MILLFTQGHNYVANLTRKKVYIIFSQSDDLYLDGDRAHTSTASLVKKICSQAFLLRFTRNKPYHPFRKRLEGPLYEIAINYCTRACTLIIKQRTTLQHSFTHSLFNWLKHEIHDGLTVWFLVARSGTRTAKLLGLTASGVSDEQRAVVGDQNVADLLLGLFIHVWNTTSTSVTSRISKYLSTCCFVKGINAENLQFFWSCQNKKSVHILTSCGFWFVFCQASLFWLSINSISE